MKILFIIFIIGMLAEVALVNIGYMLFARLWGNPAYVKYWNIWKVVFFIILGIIAIDVMLLLGGCFYYIFKSLVDGGIL